MPTTTGSRGRFTRRSAEMAVSCALGGAIGVARPGSGWIASLAFGTIAGLLVAVVGSLRLRRSAPDERDLAIERNSYTAAAWAMMLALGIATLLARMNGQEIRVYVAIFLAGATVQGLTTVWLKRVG